jgi:XTP/dITP diphosphohydrolase
MNTIEQKKQAFERLLIIMDELRAQCPWDMKQTMESLRYLSIEELYELSDAISSKNMDEIKKELGDVMLHLVFYSKIASETNDFDIADVLNSVCDKLIRRHPHIYGEIKVNGEEDVKKNWEQIKLAEGNKTVLSGVPQSLPALVKAIRIQEKARSVGFDWDEKSQVWAKVLEEINEFQHEEKLGNQEKMNAEFGDLIFALVNYARFVGVNPEDALEATNKKFIKRFTYLETQSKADGKELSKMTLSEMDEYWNQAKKVG